MLCACHSTMGRQQFQELPNSTNAVESHNRFGRTAHRQPLKSAMMATYREDMSRCLEMMARRNGLPTSYDNLSLSARSERSAQQSSARRKRLRNSDNDDAEGPPDTKRTFNSGMCILYTQSRLYSFVVVRHNTWQKE